MNNNNSIKSLPFSIAAVKTATIDPSSRLAHEKPGFDLFSERHDMLSFANQTHVAVTVCAVNELIMTGKTRRRIEAHLSVNLRDTVTGETVSGRSLDLTFRRDNLLSEGRVDIPLDHKSTEFTHPYAIDVTDRDSGELLESTRVRFYSMPGIRMLPTHWFQPIEAFVKGPCYFDADTYITPGDRAETDMSVVFRMELKADATLMPGVPELTVRVVSPTGQEIEVLIEPTVKSYGPGNTPSILEYSLDFRIPDENNHVERGVFYAELSCMKWAITGFLFSSEGEAESGTVPGDEMASIPEYKPSDGEREWQALCDRRYKAAKEREEKERALSISQSMAETESESPLDMLIGLEDVKAKVTAQTRMARFLALRDLHRLPAVNAPLHAVFMGSPGTGKTTVAKIIGEELKKAGVLTGGHVVVKERSTLVGRYYGDEEKATREAIEEAEGGILFIDEAYQLHQPDDPRDPGKFVIETLMTVLADESRRNWMLILAGYTGPMNRLFEINPGLRSRIPDSNIYRFDDYTSGQLMEIAAGYLSRHSFSLTDKANEKLRARLESDYTARDETFGNARHVINMIQTEILPAMAMRLATVDDPTEEQLCLIEDIDIPAPTAPTVKRLSRPSIGFAV